VSAFWDGTSQTHLRCEIAQLGFANAQSWKDPKPWALHATVPPQLVGEGASKIGFGDGEYSQIGFTNRYKGYRRLMGDQDRHYRRVSEGVLVRIKAENLPVLIEAEERTRSNNHYRGALAEWGRDKPTIVASTTGPTLAEALFQTWPLEAL
jgi:hypothetical protein